MKFTIVGNPIGKPRMTQRDKWKVRDCVFRYRKWADSARLQAGQYPQNPLAVSIMAFFYMPDSWSEKKKVEMRGRSHRVKPDIDNIFKAVADVLWKNDSGIAIASMSKYWDDGQGPRVEVEVS